MSNKAPLFPHRHRIQKSDRTKLLNQNPLVIWFTGLSGSGKSTLAELLEEELSKREFKTMLLDGDNIREGLNKDLSFTAEERKENLRRIGEVCKLFNEAGLIVINSFISPFRSDRDRIRSLFNPDEFMEIYVSTSLEVCEQRDTNGLYKMARSGKLKNFTGIDSPYEAPLNPELVLDTGNMPVTDCIQQMLKLVLERVVIK